MAERCGVRRFLLLLSVGAGIVGAVTIVTCTPGWRTEAPRRSANEIQRRAVLLRGIYFAAWGRHGRMPTKSELEGEADRVTAATGNPFDRRYRAVEVKGALCLLEVPRPGQTLVLYVSENGRVVLQCRSESPAADLLASGDGPS
jgi:hypothetical protein